MKKCVFFFILLLSVASWGDDLGGFKSWVNSLKNVNEQDKTYALAMTSSSPHEAYSLFSQGCKNGDAKACYQLAMLEASQYNYDGLILLRSLSLDTSLSPTLNLQAAKALGALSLDLFGNNYAAINLSLKTLVKFSEHNDPEIDLLLAHIYDRLQLHREADELLTKACSSERATKMVNEICQSQWVQTIRPDGVVQDNTQSQGGQCTAQ